MPRPEEKGHFRRIMAYIEKHVGGIPSYENTIEQLRAHPPGFRRALCIYFSDADIDNGGFNQYYYNGFGCMTMSAIEGYERLGAVRMAQIMKSSLYVCLHSYPDVAKETRLGMPAAYLDGFSPLAATFEQLDSLYYEEAERLPGSGDVDSPYPLGAIDYYYENYPEDFGRREAPIVVVDLSTVKTAADLLAAVSQALGLPGTFGNNLDKFAHALELVLLASVDLPRLSIRGWERVTKLMPRDWELLLECFRELGKEYPESSVVLNLIEQNHA